MQRPGIGSRPRLKSALTRLEPLKGIEQLDAGLPHLVSVWSKLLGMLNGESNSVHRNTSLVCHLKFNWRRPRVGFGFDQFDDLAHSFRAHGSHLLFRAFNGSYSDSKRTSRFTRTVNL